MLVSKINPGITTTVSVRPRLDWHNEWPQKCAERPWHAQTGRPYLTLGRNFPRGILRIHTITSLLPNLSKCHALPTRALTPAFCSLSLKCAFLQSSSQLLLKLWILLQVLPPQWTVPTPTKNPPTLGSHGTMCLHTRGTVIISRLSDWLMSVSSNRPLKKAHTHMSGFLHLRCPCT